MPRFFIFISAFFLFYAPLFICRSALAGPIYNFTEQIQMSFATIIADPTGDVITQPPSNTNASAANGSIVEGTTRPGFFSVRGDNGASVSISFSSGDVISGPGASMALGNFTHNAGVTPSFNALGRLNFSVGAQLTINSGQGSGSYSGTYTVTVEYN